MRVCRRCRESKENSDFYGKRSKSAVCRACYKAKKAPQERLHKATVEWKTRINNRERHRRQDPNYRALYLCKDARKSDRKFGRTNSLTMEFVVEALQQPCTYCGETQLKMTLDRKDNQLGHTEHNCVPCCVRCNYMRRDMPYVAWLGLVVSVREVREAGLFGAWTCGIHQRHGEYIRKGAELGC